MPNTEYYKLINTIKERLDIVDIVSEYVELKKSASNYLGVCPFHNDTKPSLSVNSSKGIYKCFVCGEGGDAIRFIMRIKNQTFRDTILELALKYKIELKEHTSEQNSKQERYMLEIYAKAASYYHSMLKNSKINAKAISFLEARNIGEKAINNFIIGFAPNRFNSLYNELSKDFSTDLLEKVGLIFRSKNGNWVDRFRNRIIIPIQNENGEIIAFGARALENKQIPKYLNSPSSTIYNKSKILYALNLAKEAIKKEDSVLVMEGYFDVITAHMNGIKNAVATCGTALTSEQVKLLSKYTRSNRFLLSFDSDAAGINAAKRAGKVTKEVFTHLGNNAGSSLYEVRVLTIPDNKDPDEYIRTHGSDKYLKCIANAPFLIDFLFDIVLKTKTEIKTPQDKALFALQFFEIISDIDNKIVQFEYVKKLANILELNESIILYELEKYIKVHLEDIKTRCKKTFN